MIKLIDLLKEALFVNSKGELIDDKDDDEPTPEEIEHLKKLGFDVQVLSDEDVHWYWQALNGNLIGPSSDNPESIIELPILSEKARDNYINGILRHDNLWMKKRSKEKTNYKDYDIFDEETYYFVDKEGKIVGKHENSLDDLIEQVKKDPKKFINCMLKKYTKL